MNHLPVYASADEVLKATYADVLNFGAEASPRGLRTLEVGPYAFVLSNPRSRCVTIPARRWSFPLAVGEFCWHVSGSRDVDFLAWYAARWRDFSDDGRSIVGSCYGHQIFAHSDQGESQWERALNTLRHDPQSRRAVLYLSGDPSLLRGDSKDFPCGSSLQFLIRDGALDVIATMRSNDAHYGLPYDLFLFTMLQELAATTLKLPLGKYIHVANSMHLYEKDLPVAEKLSSDVGVKDASMPPMGDVTDLARFLLVESQYRQSQASEMLALSTYWRDLAEVLRWYDAVKMSNSETRSLPTNPFYAFLVKQGPKPRPAP